MAKSGAVKVRSKVKAEDGLSRTADGLEGVGPATAKKLKALGVAEVFTPGASTQEAVEFIRGAVRS